MMTRVRRPAASLLIALIVATPVFAAAELKVLLPLGRAAYETNERIDISVVRIAAEPLAAGTLALTLAGDDGSRLAFTFPVAAVEPAVGQARRTEHLYLDGRLLRPGRYAVEIGCDGAAARTEIEVYSHVRETDFRLIYWVPREALGPVQQMLGRGGFGFNLFWGGYAPWTENLIRGGLDYMQCCTMGGGHQMDLRQECDWSDPYVLGGGIARTTRQVFADRTRPNVIGVHFYDEPGLTWWQHPRTGERVPYNIPSQDRAFLSAYGRQAPQYDAVKADDPASAAAWAHLAHWKLSFMEAAWKLARFGVSYAQPDFLSANQSVYAWNAFTDGYYFNVQRSMPVMGGHGGYDDYGSGYFQTALFLSMGRMRDLAKPTWYLPTWGGITPDRMRLEQYLSFIQNIQGMMVPPPVNLAKSTEEKAADGIAESNLIMGRLGTIFTAMPPTRPPNAVLYSLSQNIYCQTRALRGPRDEAGRADYGHYQVFQMRALHVAHLTSQMPFFPIVEEDVLDGTLAAHHRAVVLPKVEYLPPEVIAGFEAFIAGGGTVVLSDDATVSIKGAKKLGAAVPAVDYKSTEIPEYLKLCQPTAAALKARLKEAGVGPVFESDGPSIAAWRQAEGDVEYLFAVNVACDAERGGYNPIRPAVAAIRLPGDGRPVYDAVLGGSVAGFEKKGNELAGRFRFGAGQMKVFARTARPIGGVQVATPVIFCDYTVAQDPIRVEIGAAVVDSQEQVLSGCVPLEVRITDPLGVERYHLYRAAEKGWLKLSLPLAANEPPGRWTVSVRELLAGTEGASSFTTKPAGQCGAAAGAAHRAVYFGDDRENIFRFFRLHHDVTIVVGSSDFCAPAAERLAKALAPWGIRCRTVSAADAAKAHDVPEEGRATWAGLAGRFDAAKPNPANSGFAIDGPAILVGNPEDNAIIKFLEDNRFLPYTPVAAARAAGLKSVEAKLKAEVKKWEKADPKTRGPMPQEPTPPADDFPGRGRGMIAWQADGIGYGLQESITLIAYDEAGMAEAVGTMYEAATGLDPLMKWRPPASASVAPASKAPPKPPEAKVAWRIVLPDRAAAVLRLPNDRFAVLAKDGTLAAIDRGGKAAWRQELDGGEQWRLAVSEGGKTIAVGASHHLLAFTGDGKAMFDVPMRFRQPGAEGKPVSPPVGLAVSADGSRIAVGTASGLLMVLDAAGKTLWSVGGMADEEFSKFKADLAEWKAAAPKREAEKKASKDAQAARKTAMAAWEQADKKTRGPAPEQPKAPKNPPQPRAPLPPVYVDLWFSADGKTLNAVPAKGPAACFAVADGKPVEGAAPPARAAPQDEKFAQPGRMVKKAVAGDGVTAVAYWGGWVAVIDAAGAIKSSQQLAHDVADMTWLGGRLVVGLADGSIVALDAR